MTAGTAIARNHKKMNLDYVPLLPTQRDLYAIPRGMDRFRQYLRTLTSEGANLNLPPLVAMNPMAKEHVTALLDALLALDADGVAARAVADAAAEVAHVPGDFKATLVVVDDRMGGWTNRYAVEFDHRFRSVPSADLRRPRWSKHLWITGYLWSSEPASERTVREAILTAVYRTAYVLSHGQARTLGNMLTQEGRVMAQAGCTAPILDEDDIEYTREVIAPMLADDDKRIAIECLFGDEAGRTLGFTPRGLSPWAGLALALHDARAPATRLP